MDELKKIKLLVVPSKTCATNLRLETMKIHFKIIVSKVIDSQSDQKNLLYFLYFLKGVGVQYLTSE